jgi:hypothetical protein
VDALKRRYQVFVSSTYEDLKEERQQVIQALLETKCIPLGMELFPAASIQQWELIKRVIAECDYYIVLIAGRYGSLGQEGISYTEMEFDYALEIGKPVLGFIHLNTQDLAGSKLEKTDAGKQKLELFSQKVKGLLCRHWSSAADLGSAVKSAILHELEFDPKPGWVRADAVPASDTVEKLKQKIADLEERLKHRASTHFRYPDGPDTLSVTAKIKYGFEKGSEAHFEFLAKQSVEHKFEVTWDDLLRMLARLLTTGATLDELTKELCAELQSLRRDEILKQIGTEDDEYICTTSQRVLQPPLKTLMARKLVKMEAGPYGNWENPDWRFTPAGLQYLAELEAIRRSP